MVRRLSRRSLNKSYQWSVKGYNLKDKQGHKFAMRLSDPKLNNKTTGTYHDQLADRHLHKFSFPLSPLRFIWFFQSTLIHLVQFGPQ